MRQYSKQLLGIILLFIIINSALCYNSEPLKQNIFIKMIFSLVQRCFQSGLCKNILSYATSLVNIIPAPVLYIIKSSFGSFKNLIMKMLSYFTSNKSNNQDGNSKSKINNDQCNNTKQERIVDDLRKNIHLSLQYINNSLINGCENINKSLLISLKSEVKLGIQRVVYLISENETYKRCQTWNQILKKTNKEFYSYYEIGLNSFQDCGIDF